MKPAKKKTKPTGIIRKPEYVSTPGVGRSPLKFCCDNGQEYNTAELAKAVGITRETMRRRLKKHGWQSSEIFKKPVYRNIPKMLESMRQNACGGNSEWAQLGRKER